MAVAKQQQNNRNNIFMFVLLAVFIGLVAYALLNQSQDIKEYTYTEFISALEEGSITTITSEPIAGEVNQDAYLVEGTHTYNGVEGEFKLDVPNSTFLNDIKILALEQDIPYTHTATNPITFYDILWILIPIIMIVVFIFLFTRNNSNKQAFDFGKSRAKLNRQKTTKFDQVAGIKEEKEELEEIIDFLKNPKKYVELGAKIPKGVLLMGPPGTGKTLLARATAGEADVPFYTISGSEFLEMFVGVGASRVRDMFNTAKRNAPCILFIDEIDAVGRQRGTGLGGGHDEREQTLNQLLVEMDGFGHNSGVIVMAATNRPDILDPALLRPGRFDRQITIGRPDVKGREAILKVHARNKKFSDKVTFTEIARRTPGFTGADLENLLNEAALLAARENKKVIKLYHIDEAVDRVLMGPAKKSKVFTKKERDFIAYHEAGHAVIGIKLASADSVHKVTIIPRGQAGGYNLMLPDEEQSFLMTKEDLLARIVGLLGGRVAEEVQFDEITTGAHNDFQKATQIARSMVTEYGMSKLGPIQYEQRRGSVFLGRDYASDKSFSDAVALEIDNEVRAIIDECYSKTKELITTNKDLLDLLATWLLKVETLTKEDIKELVETKTLTWYDKKQSKEEANQEVKEETNEN